MSESVSVERIVAARHIPVVLLIAIVGGTVGVGIGAHHWVLWPAIIGASVQVVLGRQESADSGMPSSGPEIPIALIDQAFGEVDTDSIAEHIKDATETGVLTATENAAAISSHIGKWDEELKPLAALFDGGTSEKSLIQCLRHVGSVKASLMALQSDRDEVVLRLKDVAAAKECLAELEVLSEREAEIMEALACKSTAAANMADEVWSAFALDVDREREVLRNSSNRIVIELQFQDMIRQELERMQHRFRVPLQVLQIVAGEIASGELPKERYEARTRELCRTVFEETKVQTTHDFCALDDETTGEFEMF